MLKFQYKQLGINQYLIYVRIDSPDTNMKQDLYEAYSKNHQTLTQRLASQFLGMRSNKHGNLLATLDTIGLI